MQKAQSRNNVFDIAKGIGIYLVVLGHFCLGGNYAEGYLYAVIYSFHMPLFFFISGYLYKERTVKDTVSLVCKKFLVPTYMFLIVDVAISIAMGYYRNAENLPLYLLNTLFVTRGIKGGSAVMNDPLWFLMAMSVILVAKSITMKHKKANYCLYTIIIAVLCIKQFVLKNLTLGLSWYVNWYFCYLFFDAGFYFKKYNLLSKFNKNKNITFIILVFEMLIMIFIPVANGTSTIASFQFGNIIPLTFLVGLTGSDFVFIISKIIDKNTKHLRKVLGFLGQHSLVVMVSHFVFSTSFPKQGIFICIVASTVFVIIEITIVYCYVICKQKLLTRKNKEENYEICRC